MGFLKRYNCQE